MINEKLAIDAIVVQAEGFRPHPFQTFRSLSRVHQEFLIAVQKERSPQEALGISRSTFYRRRQQLHFIFGLADLRSIPIGN